MIWGNWEEAILALMMWREARNQEEVGMRATGHVAWNRHVESRRELAAVICDDAQFTSINPPKKSYDPQLDVWPTSNDLTFLGALRMAGEIVAETSIDPTNGATFYWNPLKSDRGGWFERIIAQGMAYEKCATIGAHEFFREKVQGGSRLILQGNGDPQQKKTDLP